MIDIVGTAPFTMCVGHPNNVTVAPSFRNKVEVVFRSYLADSVDMSCLFLGWSAKSIYYSGLVLGLIATNSRTRYLETVLIRPYSYVFA